MPINKRNLINVLTAMKQTYLENPVQSVRGSSFIYHLHNYCIQELSSAVKDGQIQIIDYDDMVLSSNKPHYPKVQIDPRKLQLMPEATLFGSHKNKDEDISLTHYANGPQIVIGIRSQMSSVAKNLETYYEGIIGECISLHDRFPMATVGYVYLLPKKPIHPSHLDEKVDLNKAEELFKKITNRPDWRGPSDKYEHFAFLKVDFDTDPPSIINTCDELKIDNFFDKLIDTYNERNFFNKLNKK